MVKKQAGTRPLIFMCHNGLDKRDVERLSHDLAEEGLAPWLDKWEIAGRAASQPGHAEVLARCSRVLVCVGPSGLGSRQQEDLHAAIHRSEKQQLDLITPVLLPGASTEPDWPAYIRQLPRRRPSRRLEPRGS